eukprot:CAMPEP_0168345646 /NCGR_PEP_ID=MMETSP0213-20121227/17705_1 /TAXON_ID=151035 /ORGANISM="Euplotes harpa, Strain FSP1.4" /LENGTH=31 /DNA_ID= /DNA_START= /DNA_END= /DNA_ORIENTATION=
MKKLLASNPSFKTASNDNLSKDNHRDSKPKL